MNKKYSVGIVLYVLFLVVTFLLMIVGGGQSQDSGGFIDFSGLFYAFIIFLALVGTLLFGLYILLVYTYNLGGAASWAAMGLAARIALRLLICQQE